jgi:hypothetical protein
MVAKAKQDAEGNLYFEGSGTKLVNSVGLSNPYYSSVMKALKDMDCVRQARRGGGGQGSVWFLLQEPTEELWAAMQAAKPVGQKVSMEEVYQAQRAMLARLSDLENKVAMLEALNG